MMRHVLILLLPALLSACFLTDRKSEVDPTFLENPATLRDGGSSGRLPVVTFERNQADLGTILQGDVVRRSFAFTNTGNAPLIVVDVKASCGCTVLKDYPREPLVPGEKGEVNVEFDSANKWGEQTIVITMSTNARPATQMMTMNVNILAPESEI